MHNRSTLAIALYLVLFMSLISFPSAAFAVPMDGTADVFISEKMDSNGNFISSLTTYQLIESKAKKRINLKLKKGKAENKKQQGEALAGLLTGDALAIEIFSPKGKRKLKRVKEILLTDRAPKKAKHRKSQAIGRIVKLESDGSSAAVAGGDIAVQAVQQRSIVALVLQFPGSTAANKTTVEDMMFKRIDSLRGTYLETSQGQLDFIADNNLDSQVDVYGPFTVNALSNCDWGNGLATAASEANAAAAAAGINVGNWQHVVYVLDPATSCGWAGIASLGGGRAFVDGSYASWEVVYTHEVGHNLGMHHSSTDPEDDGKINSEYGDHECFMGNPSQNMNLNAPHKYQMGFVSGAQVSDVGTGTFRISPLDQESAVALYPQVLRVQAQSGMYYLSYRRQQGLDSILSTAYADKTQVHRYTSGASRTMLIASLADGVGFASTAGVLFQQVTHTADYAEVLISGDCNAFDPVVSISPSVQTAAIAGEDLSYSVTVQNRDSSFCAATTFDIADTVPTGWSSQLSATSLTIQPGSSASATLSVTSIAPLADGSYPISVAAVDNDGVDPAHAQAQGSGTYQIDTSPPDAVSDLAATVKPKGKIQLTWSAPASNIVVYHISRDGQEIATTGGTSYLDSGLTACTQYSYAVTAEDQFERVSAESLLPVTSKCKGGGGSDGGGGKPDKGDKPGKGNNKLRRLKLRR